MSVSLCRPLLAALAAGFAALASAAPAPTRDLVLADGSRISHDVLTVGGTDLQAFAGINGRIWLAPVFRAMQHNKQARNKAAPSRRAGR